MKRIILFIFLFFSISFFFGQMNPEKWKEDINFLRENLSKKHYNLFFKRDKVLFDRDLDNLISQSGKLSDLEIALKLQQIIAKQGDSHTNADYGKLMISNTKLPIKTYWFADGLYVIKTTKEYEDLLGKKIISINNYSLKQFSDSLSTIFVRENQAIVKKTIPNLIVQTQLLKFFGFEKNQKYTLQCSDNQNIKEKELIPENFLKTSQISVKPKNISFLWKNENKYFTGNYFLKDKTYYILYNKCVSKESPSIFTGKPAAEKLPSFLEFQDKILEDLKKLKIEKVIFDMRLNGGGSSPQGTKLINEILKLPEINKKGKLFVITGRNTFSSAIINTMDFKNSNAIFVGEETAGKPNHFGEVRGFTLPNSGIEISYSTKYFNQYKNDDSTIKPDFMIEESFENFMNGIDPVFEFVKNYKKT